MDKIVFSEEEIKNPTPETIKTLANLLRIVMAEYKMSINGVEVKPNEVKIVVTENLGVGEKLGG